MNARELEEKLGMIPGGTLTAFVALAEHVLPSAPWDAFELLWLRIPWLEEGTYAVAMRCSTPKNVHPFVETGGDLNHFGFLLDGDMPTDERPIVYVAPKDDDEATEIVAPNLRAFLGLVAVAFGEVVSRGATDEEWATFRREWYGDDPARLAEMDRLSELLCSIPGVVRPTNPASVANAYPNQAFERHDAAVSPNPKFHEARRLVDAARGRVLALAEGMIDGRVLDGGALAGAKHDATSSLIAALDALAALDESVAMALVSTWRSEPTVWRALSRGVSGDLAGHLIRYMGDAVSAGPSTRGRRDSP